MEGIIVKLWLLIDDKEVEREVEEYDGSGMYEGYKVVGVQVCLDK